MELELDTLTAPPKKFSADRKRFQEGINPLLPVVVLDEKGTIQHLTHPARRLLEYQPHQRVEPSFFAHIHNKNLYQVMRDVADMVCYGKTKASWMMRLNTGLGRWRWYKATAHNGLTKPTAHITIILRDV